MADGTNTVISAPDAAPTPQGNSQGKNLVDQYDLGDTVQSAPVLTPEITSEPTSTTTREETAPPVENLPLEASRPLPPRDPDTGQFVKPALHSPRIKQMAVDFGLSDEEIADHTPSSLESTVLHLHRQARELRRDNDRERLVTTGGENQAPLVSTQAQPPVPGRGEPDAGELSFNADDYDPGIAKFMGVVQSQAKEIKELKALVGQLSQGEQRRQVQSIAAQCDQAFEKHKTVLGEGRGHEMDASDPMMIRRKAVLSIVQTMNKGTLQQRIDKAVETLFGGQTRTPEAPRRNGVSVEDWDKAGLSRPTQRKGAPEPQGREKAEKSVAAALRELESTETDLPADSFLD